MKQTIHFVFGILLLVSCLFLASCKKGILEPDVFDPVTTGLAALPPDTGGQHTALPFGTDNAPYGYYLYKPSGYSDGGPKFPLLIFLHGSGESGNSKGNPGTLDKILAHGPPKLIKAGKWAPQYPMIVASAQCHESWWDYQKVRKFIEFIRTQYQVDTTRIYLTGLSMGGFATYDQVLAFGSKSHIAAAVPIAGSSIINTATLTNGLTTPIWAFHGASDPTVSPDFDKNFHMQLNALAPKVREKLTVYPGVGHDSWTMTYDGTGKGKEDANYDAFSTDIYSWMFQYKLQ